MSTKAYEEQESKLDKDERPTAQVLYACDVFRRHITGTSCVFPHEFLEIAAVETDDLDEIFRTFNGPESFSFDVAWGRVYFNSRSMCIGDVVVKSDGSAWICTAKGWLPIEEGEDFVFDEALRDAMWPDSPSRLL